MAEVASVLAPSSATAFSSSAVFCSRLATRLCADVPLESETPSTELSLSAAPCTGGCCCWIPAMAATSDCDRKPNWAAELAAEGSSFAVLPLGLPVISCGAAVVATVALSWASACDWARVWRKLGPGFLADWAAPFLPLAAAGVDWACLEALLCWLCELLEELRAWLPDELLLRLEALLPEWCVVLLPSLLFPLLPVLSELEEE